jgi:hypothetical protein
MKPKAIPGAWKNDAGKLRYSLLDWGALAEVVAVFTYGAELYAPRGWRHVPHAEERYEDALVRHYAKYKQGERFDSESSLPHLAHVAWNALALLSFEVPKLPPLQERLSKAIRNARDLKQKREKSA